jgi:hypothetical protein
MILNIIGFWFFKQQIATRTRMLYLVFVGGQMWGIKWKITLLYEMTQPPIQ